MNKTIRQLIFLLLMIQLFFDNFNPAFAQNPSSTNYKIHDYSFGGGGTKESSSSNYKLHGIIGEVEFGKPESTNFKIGSGLTYLLKANVPPAPIFSNPSQNYDRLKFILNTGENPSDATFALQVSTTSDFSSNILYVKPDNTLGTTLETSDYQTYTAWGGASGQYITGLSENTTYYMRIQARHGNYTQSEYGPSSTATTSYISLTFSISSNSLTFNRLNSGNSYTDSTKSTILTTSTNAYNGYVINARQASSLTAADIGTIPDFTSPNSSPTAWSGYGFGYTTNDDNLTGGTVDRFTNGGTKYAGFTTSSPGDPVADHSGPVLTTINNETFTISYRISVSETQGAGTYSNTIMYIVVPNY